MLRLNLGLDTKKWEDQDNYKGGWEKRLDHSGKIRLKGAGRKKGLY